MSQEIENQIPDEQQELVVQANNDDHVLEQEVAPGDQEQQDDEQDVVLQQEQDEEDHNKEHDEEEQSDNVLEPERQDEQQEQLKIADRHDIVSTSSNSGAADTSVPAETRPPQEQRLHRQLVASRDRGIITTINVTMNVVTGSLRFIASIFFISAAVHFHYNMWDNTNIQNTGDKQGALFMTGFVFLGAAFVLEFYYNTKSENHENHMLFVISMFSVFLLFIGSIFPLISTVNDPDVFAGFFIVGSLILGSCQALELTFYLRRDDDGTTNKIMITSMTLAVLGSFFFFLGGVFFTEKVVLDEYYFYKAIERHAALFIVGGMAYMFHAVCYLIDTTQQEST